MAERKALTHYYPPDFDPAKIPRRKVAADRQQAARLMAPFSMQCLSCREYIYKGKKFNARKEQVLNEDYLGIKIFRFYIKCTQCSSEITFKTDPKNTDYVAEHGAKRNFEPWRATEEDEAESSSAGMTEEEKRAAAAESADPMKAIENKTLDSRREMEVLDALQDIRTRNARLERVDTDALLAARAPSTRQSAVEETESQAALEQDEALVRKYFGKALDGPTADPSSSATSSSVRVKRKVVSDDDDVEPDIHSLLATSIPPPFPAAPMSAPPPPKMKKKKNGPNAFGLVKRKPVT